MKWSLLVFVGLFFAAPAFAESVAYPGPGMYRSGARAVNVNVGVRTGGYGYPGAYRAPGPYPSGVGSHGINTLGPLRAGVQGGLMVRGGGQPCGRPCARPCGRRKARCFSVSIRIGGGKGRCGRNFRRCRRRC